jgi:hypothetical protein
MSKVNVIQSRLDILSLASYPERAKQIFVKVSPQTHLYSFKKILFVLHMF